MKTKQRMIRCQRAESPAKPFSPKSKNPLPQVNLRQSTRKLNVRVARGNVPWLTELNRLSLRIPDESRDFVRRTFTLKKIESKIFAVVEMFILRKSFLN